MGGNFHRNIQSRTKPLKQVKMILLEEIGTYLESWASIETYADNEKVDQYFDEEIKRITAGITETEILEEKWDGYNYYTKAKITVDPDDVIEKINQSLINRKNSKELEKLKELLTNTSEELALKSEEIQTLNAKLVARKEDLNSKSKQIESLERKLQEYRNSLQKLNAKKRKLESEVERIRRRINNATIKAKNNIILGMTPEEVVKVAGPPRSRADCVQVFYNYGNVWVMFESGIVTSVFYAKYFIGPCNIVTGDYRERNIARSTY